MTEKPPFMNLNIYVDIMHICTNDVLKLLIFANFVYFINKMASLSVIMYQQLNYKKNIIVKLLN